MVCGIQIGGIFIRETKIRPVRAALFAALLPICAWISLPIADIAFTLQTFGIFLALFTLGGKWGCAAILVYLLLGCVGLPVFAGFQGGIGILAGVTGGFLWGFLACGLIYWAFEKLCKPIGAILGLLACYACGSLWFCLYAGETGFLAALVKCVVPYLIPDGIKLHLAWSVHRRLPGR